MSNIPAELRYSEDHEWISTSAPWKIGVSDYAQNALGDLTYVELPSVGDTFEKGQEFGTLESTKSVSPLFMPVAGTIKAVNEALVDAPEKVNQDPYGEGWLIEIESAEGVSELLDAAAYKAHLEMFCRFFCVIWIKGKPLFFFHDLFVIDGREQWLFDCHKR